MIMAGNMKAILQSATHNLLSDDTVKFFELNGFVAVSDGSPRQEVETIRQTLEALHHKNVGFKEGAQFDAASADVDGEPRRFPQILQPGNYAPALRETAFFRTASAIATQLLGPQARFCADISFLKPARSGAETAWHQDEAFHDPLFDRRELSFWLALQPTDRSNSCMEFLPGSHNWPVLMHGPLGGDHRVHALECIGDFDRSKAVACPLPAGGFTIHTGLTLHKAGPNTSDRTRLGYVLIFDVPPTLRTTPRAFPWRDGRRTAREAREQAWRRRGGMLIYMWRQRSRIRPAHIPYGLFALWTAFIGMLRRQ